MRFIPGAAAGLIIAMGIAWARLSGPREIKPPDSFLDSEVTLGDAAQTGSCYSLRLLLRQHLLLTSGAVGSWTKDDNDGWSFHVEWIEQRGGGPESNWETLKLAARNGQVMPQSLATPRSDHEPLPPFMRELMSWPAERRAQKVERCQNGNAR